MFSKKNRLSKTQDVQQALKLGRAFFSPFFNVKFLPSGRAKRFTVVVSTKVAKKAARRNRIKRLLREYARLHLASFSPGDYIIMVKPAAEKLDDKILPRNFAQWLAASKLLRPP